MIEVLEPNVANQIAAGEVVQRPSSIVKELMENAIDAGASKVIVQCVDGGRTMISVIDDGAGMSAQDASKAFLRHATSKIRKAEDLFSLRTFGFRGEALASIASVAQVEMRTRRLADDIGTLVEVSAGEVVKKEMVDSPKGTTISVRNLFFNIPARRKFLKPDRTESAAAYTEFVRVAMVNPDIEFAFHNNLTDKPLVLSSGGLHQRIVELTKQTLRKKLLPVDLDTELVRLNGYVGTPDTATTKSGSAQYLFVNGRFVRSAFLQRAVLQAYDRLIGAGTFPSYFLFVELSPSSIDVNISPTKTEVKFDDEQAVFHTIYSAVKGCLGRSNVVEAIDFDGEPSLIDIPSYTPSKHDPTSLPTMPVAHSGRQYNPFTSYDTTSWESDRGKGIDVEKIPFMEDLPTEMLDTQQSVINVRQSWVGFELDDKYIVVKSAEGLAVINTARARHRIAFEKMVNGSADLVAQYLIAPERLDLDFAQKSALQSNLEAVEALGFVLSCSDSAWELHALPSGLDRSSFDAVLDALLDGSQASVVERLAEKLLRGVLNEKVGSVADISAFVSELMSCHEPSFTYSGLPIIETISRQEIEKRMKGAPKN